MDNSFLKHYFRKTSSYKGNVGTFAGPETVQPDYTDLLGTLIVGPNYLPRPRGGESVYDRLRSRDRTQAISEEGAEMLKKYPQLAFMGDPHQAAAHLHDLAHNPALMAQFH